MLTKIQPPCETFLVVSGTTKLICFNVCSLLLANNLKSKNKVRNADLLPFLGVDTSGTPPFWPPFLFCVRYFGHLEHASNVSAATVHGVALNLAGDRRWMTN